MERVKADGERGREERQMEREGEREGRWRERERGKADGERGREERQIERGKADGDYRISMRSLF